MKEPPQHILEQFVIEIFMIGQAILPDLGVFKIFKVRLFIEDRGHLWPPDLVRIF